MKNIYAVSALACCSFIGNAQIVNIPSPGLEYVLLNGNCADTNGDGTIDGDVDTNNDGEIQVSEALSVTYLEISNWNLDSFEGINYFTNLRTLICVNNDFTTLNLTNLINLETLDCNSHHT
jgi:hypothetical protein